MNLDGIHLPSDKVIKSLEEADSNKYLGVLEADEVTVNEMRDKVKKEYCKRVRNKCWKQSYIVRMFSKLLILGSISDEIFCSILRVVKISTRDN